MKNSFYTSFGIWLVVVSLLGVPIVWRDALVALSGIFLILISIGPAILRKLYIKPKQKRKQEKSEYQNSHTPPYLKESGGEVNVSSNKEDNVKNLS